MFTSTELYTLRWERRNDQVSCTALHFLLRLQETAPLDHGQLSNQQEPRALGQNLLFRKPAYLRCREWVFHRNETACTMLIRITWLPRTHTGRCYRPGRAGAAPHRSSGIYVCRLVTLARASLWGLAHVICQSNFRTKVLVGVATDSRN